MPAKSTAQRQLMAIAEHEPGKLLGKNKKILGSMSKGQLHDFASTKGLKNEHVDRPPIRGTKVSAPKLDGGSEVPSPASKDSGKADRISRLKNLRNPAATNNPPVESPAAPSPGGGGDAVSIKVMQNLEDMEAMKKLFALQNLGFGR